MAQDPLIVKWLEEGKLSTRAAESLTRWMTEPDYAAMMLAVVQLNRYSPITNRKGLLPRV